MSESLLAVDLGLKTGLARYKRDGRLDWYRSSNLGSRPRLKKAVSSVLQESSPVRFVVIEGGGDLAVPWIAACRRDGIEVIQVAAHDWRDGLLLPREQRSGFDAKKNASALARKIIDWSGAKRPTSLRHDVAEAICVGLWGVLKVGWLEQRLWNDGIRPLKDHRTLP